MEALANELGPDEQAEVNDLIEAMKSAVTAMQWECVRRCWMEGESQEDVAAAIGCNQATVSRYLDGARQALIASGYAQQLREVIGSRRGNGSGQHQRSREVAGQVRCTDAR